ncbi:Potassium-transporting ATPase C chain [metagenome]|uniref:Potassium-transporting ATPase C chain n=1 Tax=metagenome TaxID=256318 RepID=A0A2P2C0V6_9ZZZZ
MTIVHLFRHTLAGLRVLLALTVLVGVIYPLAVWGIGQGLFAWRADGSLVTSTGQHTTKPSDAAGSLLIGQDFGGRQWFHTRPSAAGDGWDTLASAGSNLGPESSDLVSAIEAHKTAVAQLEGVRPSQVPPDAVTASASGLDPQISPEYAALQAPRVAAARGLALSQVAALIDEHTQGRTFGFLGDARVNVVALNLALTRAAH